MLFTVFYKRRTLMGLLSILTDTKNFTHDYFSSKQYRSIHKFLFQEGIHIEMKAPKHKIGLINTGST